MKIRQLKGFSPPKIYCTYEAYRKMRQYVLLMEDEVGWFATVNKLEDNIYVIDDVFLPKQEVSATYTEVNQNTLVEIAMKLTSDQRSKVRCYGHSHVNMGVSPSATDHGQVDEFADGCDWFITVINNKKDDWYVSFNDYRLSQAYEFGKLEFYMPVDEDIKKELSEKTTKKTYANVSKWTRATGYSAYAGYGGWGDWDDGYWAKGAHSNNTIKNKSSEPTQELTTAKDLNMKACLDDCKECNLNEGGVCEILRTYSGGHINPKDSLCIYDLLHIDAPPHSSVLVDFYDTLDIIDDYFVFLDEEDKEAMLMDYNPHIKDAIKLEVSQ